MGSCLGISPVQKTQPIVPSLAGQLTKMPPPPPSPHLMPEFHIEPIPNCEYFSTTVNSCQNSAPYDSRPTRKCRRVAGLRLALSKILATGAIAPPPHTHTHAFAYTKKGQRLPNPKYCDCGEVSDQESGRV